MTPFQPQIGEMQADYAPKKGDLRLRLCCLRGYFHLGRKCTCASRWAAELEFRPVNDMINGNISDSFILTGRENDISHSITWARQHLGTVEMMGEVRPRVQRLLLDGCIQMEWGQTLFPMIPKHQTGR